MKNLNFKLFLIPFLLILFTLNAFSEDENGNTCNEAQALLPSGIFAASDSGSSGNGDKDYFSFTVPDNGELNVTITNTSTSNNVNLEYSSLFLGSSPCVTAVNGTISPLGTHTETVSVTTAGTYYIFLEGTRNNAATTYEISALFTPGAPSAGIDLSITKVGSVDSLLIFDTFYYTINVSNVGDSNASNVTVTDSLPADMRVDLDATHASPNSAGWTCSGETVTTVCTLDGNLTTGTLSSLELHVKAPPTDGNISNVVLVTSSADGSTIDTDVNPSSNTATEITEVVSDIDTAEHLCYYERTEIANDDYNTTCEKTGNFYYGNGCDAYVTVFENNVTDILSSPKIYKMYAPATSRGSCTYTAQGSTFGPTTSSGCNDISNSNDFGSYQDGYAVILDHNYTSNLEVNLTDVSTDNNPRVDGIAMFGDYYLEKNIDGTDLTFHHTGRIFACSGISEGGIVITSSADVIDTHIGNDNTLAGNYNASTDSSNNGTNIKYIQTMIAADQRRNIEGVHLNLDGATTLYEYNGTTATTPAYSITPYLTDDSCTANFENIIDPDTNEQLVIDIPEYSYSATGTMIVPDVVNKNARFLLIFIDPNSLSPEGQNCLANSSTSGNFARLAQCVNSEVQYKTAFGQDAWDRCGDANGDPCSSSNHGYSCGENSTSCDDYNALYDNELGCYMCTFNVQPACSSDNFAIRPEKFEVGVSDPHAPNLLRAGEGYGVSLTAKDALDNIPAEYTVTDHNFNNDLDTNTTRYFKDGVEDINDLLHGTPDLNRSTTAYMVSGLSSLSTTQPASAQEIVKAMYDDVGLVNLEVYDKEWAAVDNDDTPMDCNSSTNHTFICGDLNVTFIPHHFGFAELNITNHAGPDSNFTYIADKRGMPTTTTPTRSPMAARVQTRIEALNKNGAITENFREDDGTNVYYENPVSVTPSIRVPTIGNTNGYLYPDANESTIISQSIGFGRSGKDDNGTRNIFWDEDSYPLEFNFPREINEPANPFNVIGSYVAITLHSIYTDASTPSSPADINGSRVGDFNTTAWTECATDDGCIQENAENNATFYFGRTLSSKYFYEDISTDTANTPIAATIYCKDSATVNCDDYRFDPSGLDQDKINEPDWYLSMEHDATRGDGNVTIIIGSPLIEPVGTAASSQAVMVDGTPYTYTSGNAGNVIIINNGMKNDVNVSRGSSPTPPLTVPIELVQDGDSAAPPYTNEWLIYNEFFPAPPSPFYKVRFIGETSWSGKGQTGHVVDINASYKKSNRVDW